MDKYRAQLSLHRKYRQATMATKLSNANGTDANNAAPSNHNNTNNHQHQHQHRSLTTAIKTNEVCSSATISTASASFDSTSTNTASAPAPVHHWHPNNSHHTTRTHPNNTDANNDSALYHSKSKNHCHSEPKSTTARNAIHTQQYKSTGTTRTTSTRTGMESRKPNRIIKNNGHGSHNSSDKEYNHSNSSASNYRSTHEYTSSSFTHKSSSSSSSSSSLASQVAAKAKSKAKEKGDLRFPDSNNDHHNSRKVHQNHPRNNKNIPLQKDTCDTSTVMPIITTGRQNNCINNLPPLTNNNPNTHLNPPITSTTTTSSATLTPTTHEEETNHQSQSHNTNYSMFFVPTEAQLRWAQFHFKRKSQFVQKQIQQLMLYPLLEEDVDGAMSGDGDSSSSDSCKCSKTQKAIELSRGRRALLRVSERRTEERRKRIQMNGYIMHPDDNDFDDNDPSSSFDHHQQKQQQQSVNDESLELDDITAALHVNSSIIDDNNATTFVERRKGGTATGRDMGIIGSTILSGKKKKKKSNTTTHNGKVGGGAKHLKGKRSMVSNANEEEERMKRFEEAYLVMCNAGGSGENTIKSSSYNEAPPSTIKSSKRWTRGTNVPVAISIDGREYDDLQRSPAFKDVSSSSRFFGAEIYGAEVNGKQLKDRVASWMMHLPKKKSTLRDSLVQASPNFLRSRVPYNHDQFEKEEEGVSEEVVSPQKMKLMELVDRLQGQQLMQRFQQYDDSNNNYDNMEGIIEEEVMKEESHDDMDIDTNQVSENKKVSSPFAIGVSVSKLRNKLFQSNNRNHSTTPSDKDDMDEYQYEEDYFDGEDMINENIESKIHQMAAHLKSHNSVIDTDMQSEASVEGFECRIGSLMLSPTIITKRLNQAINAIETCQWDQVSYLVNANPWLAEMTEVEKNQYLLHKIAFHGTGNLMGKDPAPSELHEDMVTACPASIQKFDSDGNLPLHLAAAAGNVDMVMRLSKRFRGGASVRNNQGHLPLHMSVIACSTNYEITEKENLAERLVQDILDLFPGGLAVTDNDGNLPVHLVSCHLKGFIGAEVMHILLQKAEEVGDDLRFATDVKAMKHMNFDETLSDFDIDCNHEKSSILSSRNLLNWTPLMSAVKNRAGWQVLDSILCRNESEMIMCDVDANGKNILQLTLEDECYDPPSTLSILKFLPQLVTKPDCNGALPIETACLRGSQEEIIMAIALLDLPIDLDDDSIEVNNYRAEYGGSWWYLNCECDDEFTKIVREILEICNYKQTRALCFAKNEKGRSILHSATPKCKHELRKALRFDGRYEFVGNGYAGDRSKNFEALDFGTDKDPIYDGQKVTLQCYSDEMEFASVTAALQRINVDDAMLVRMRFFQVNEAESSLKTQYCVSIESPELTLSTIISNMDRRKYLNDHERLNRYISKLRKVFKMIGDGINHLHLQGIVHGHLDTHTCGKFDDGWKVLDLIGCKTIGSSMSTERTGYISPPEAVVVNNSMGRGTMNDVRLCDNIVANVSLDIWAFGKLMYEVLVGKQLIPIIDSHKMVIEKDSLFLQKLKHWNGDDLSSVVAEIETAGVGTLAADLISHCLCPFPENRPKDMKDVLTHPYWNDSRTSFQGSFRKTKRRGY